MSEHIPDSSGLPLRAMVMVLLFLGVIFLLVGFQALSSGGDGGDDADSVLSTLTTTSAPARKAGGKAGENAGERAAENIDVRVYSNSDEEGIAERTAEKLRESDWNVTEVDNLALPDVTATTVYFGESAGEREAAETVGELLRAPVQPRIADIAEQPPGVIVIVAG